MLGAFIYCSPNASIVADAYIELRETKPGFIRSTVCGWITPTGLGLFLLGCLGLFSCSPYSGDLVSSPTDSKYNFRYDPSMKPVAGETTEDEVMNYYKFGPDKRYTFPCKHQAVVGGRRYEFDRLIIYGESRNTEQNTPISREKTLRELIVFSIYLNDGKVTTYEICQWEFQPDGSELCAPLQKNCACALKAAIAEEWARKEEYERQRQNYIGKCPVEGEFTLPPPSYFELLRRRFGLD